MKRQHFAVLMLVLAGCRTEAPVAPSTPEPAPVVTACPAVVEWLGRYLKEYPYMGVPVRTRAEVANMFRRGDISRVFGVPYTYEYRVVLQQKYAETVAPCYQDRSYASVMDALKPLFEGTVENFDQGLSDQAARLDGKAQWVESAMAEIDIMPATQDGMVRLERYRAEARDYLPWLWPSEKAAFELRLEARQKYVAENLGVRVDPVTVTPVTPEIIAPPQPRERQKAAEPVRNGRTIWKRLAAKGKWAFDKINDGLSRLADDIFRETGK